MHSNKPRSGGHLHPQRRDGLRPPPLIIALATVTLTLQAQAPPREYPIRAVPLGDVRVDDDFWRARMDLNRDVTIPHIFQQNEQTTRVANFAKAARQAKGAYEGRRFNDTDVYKAIEAASYALMTSLPATTPAPARSKGTDVAGGTDVVQRRLDEIIALIAAAQEPDGYLFPARTIDPSNPAPGVGPARWVHLNGSHELYNSGHLYEAAVAHFQATGKRTLLEVAIKNANLVKSVFGPNGRKAVPGHEEIELALVKLAGATGDRSYLELARFFVDQRVSRTTPSRIPTVRSRCTTIGSTGRTICRSRSRIAPWVTRCARPTSIPE